MRLLQGDCFPDKFVLLLFTAIIHQRVWLVHFIWVAVYTTVIWVGPPVPICVVPSLPSNSCPFVCLHGVAAIVFMATTNETATSMYVYSAAFMENNV